MIDVLRKGIKDGPHHVELFYGTPSPGNAVAVERFAQNRFSWPVVATLEKRDGIWTLFYRLFRMRDSQT